MIVLKLTALCILAGGTLIAFLSSEFGPEIVLAVLSAVS
jgi:hypothetical protein